MTDHSMVERVARAMVRANYPGGTDADIDGMWEGWRLEAVAAMKAMRDCTLVYRDGGHVVHEMRGAPDDIWKAMIDAALMGEGD